LSTVCEAGRGESMGLEIAGLLVNNSKK